MKISDEKYIALFSKYYPDDVHILGCLEHDSFQFDGYLVLCKLKSTNVNYKTSINTQIQHKTSTNTTQNSTNTQIQHKTNTNTQKQHKTSTNTQIQHKTSTNTQNNTKTIQIPQKTRNKQRN